MTIADEARDNALHCEMVKYSYRQTKDGVVVSFVVHPNDMPAALATAPIGARFVSALVQVDDNELPVHQPAKESSKPGQVAPKPDRVKPGKRDWREVPYPQQAGIRINEPTFAAYLREEHSDDWHETGDADACIKLICRIESKRELSTNHKALTLWRQIDSHYEGWLAKERVGA